MRCCESVGSVRRRIFFPTRHLKIKGSVSFDQAGHNCDSMTKFAPCLRVPGRLIYKLKYSEAMLTKKLRTRVIASPFRTSISGGWMSNQRPSRQREFTVNT